MVTRKRTGNVTTKNMPLESSLPTKNEVDANDKHKRPSSSSSPIIKILHSIQVIFSLISSTSFTLTSIAAILFSPLLEGDDLQPTLLQISLGYLFLLRPLLSTLSTCIQPSKKEDRQHERVISTAFLSAIICNQFPKWASCAVASCTVLGFGLASRQLTQKRTTVVHSSDNNATTTAITNKPKKEGYKNNLQNKWSRLTLKERAALATLAVVLSLLLENFLIWVVSATYAPGIYDSPDPLQDNGRSVLESLAIRLFRVNKAWMAKRRLQSIRDGLNVQWGIVTALGASFVCLELKIGKYGATTTSAADATGRSLAGLALRALMTLAAARFIRTVSFVLTVLPSQVPDCYRRHFPMPPDNWKEWLLVGFLPNSRGGCNDLILSGHATVLTTLGCGCTSVANNAKFSVAVWTLVAVDFAIESYQGLHYSVDMWLGCIVTALLWQLTKGLEVPGDMEKKKISGTGKSKYDSQAPLDAQTIALYATPAFLGFVILTFVPEAIVNYFLVGYAIWAGIIMAKWGFTNFSQHILLCLLFVTLGSYL